MELEKKKKLSILNLSFWWWWSNLQSITLNVLHFSSIYWSAVWERRWRSLWPLPGDARPWPPAGIPHWSESSSYFFKKCNHTFFSNIFTIQRISFTTRAELKIGLRQNIAWTHWMQHNKNILDGTCREGGQNIAKTFPKERSRKVYDKR